MQPPPPPPPLRLGVGVASPVKPHRLLPNSPSPPRCRCRCRRSWFSNAEPGPTGDDASNTRNRSRRWWSDADDQLEDDDFDDDDGGGFGGAAGELFDEPWFSKVFKAYGYVLPVILASMLVATGPQAFLMAMAIPVAQSAISFALRTLSTAFRGRDQQDYYYSDYADDFEASSYSYRDSSSSWSPETAGDASSSSSSSNTKTQSAGFGGWDELDGDEHHGRSRSSSSSNSNDDAASAVRRRPTNASRMGNSRYRQAPLLMRLLVAVFPFLGSWFRML